MTEGDRVLIAAVIDCIDATLALLRTRHNLGADTSNFLRVAEMLGRARESFTQPPSPITSNLTH